MPPDCRARPTESKPPIIFKTLPHSSYSESNPPMHVSPLAFKGWKGKYSPSSSSSSDSCTAWRTFTGFCLRGRFGGAPARTPPLRFSQLFLEELFS